MNIVGNIISVLLAIVGLATVAVLVSNRANTANVIAATGAAFGGSIREAVAPVSGPSGPTSITLNNGMRFGYGGA